MTGRTQEELVAMLRSTKQGETVSVLVSRQEDIFLPRELVMESENNIHVLTHACCSFNLLLLPIMQHLWICFTLPLFLFLIFICLFCFLFFPTHFLHIVSFPLFSPKGIKPLCTPFLHHTWTHILMHSKPPRGTLLLSCPPLDC